jgi:hypothetical protein
LILRDARAAKEAAVKARAAERKAKTGSVGEVAEVELLAADLNAAVPLPSKLLWVTLTGHHQPPERLSATTVSSSLLRASVGSTEASASLLARVGVGGPTRASSWLPPRSLGHIAQAMEGMRVDDGAAAEPTD